MGSATYYTEQIVDEWAEIAYNVNGRTFPEHPNAPMGQPAAEFWPGTTMQK